MVFEGPFFRTIREQKSEPGKINRPTRGILLHPYGQNQHPTQGKKTLFMLTVQDPERTSNKGLTLEVIV